MHAPKTLKRLFGKMATAASISDFDPEFYLAHYGDLQFLKTKKKALRHYVTDGSREGRFPNEKKYRAHVASISPTLFEDFDVVAYRFLNKDLQSRFQTRREYLQHYIEHGNREGRLYRFTEDRNLDVPVPSTMRWQFIFSTSHFIAANSRYFEKQPVSREDAIDLFSSQGIEKLWPINLDYEFDVSFYREHYRSKVDKSSDAQLYSTWLSTGFPTGQAPNEYIFLSEYLGDWSYPRQFDWKRYKTLTGLPRYTSRSQALAHLFHSSTKTISRNIDLMGDDSVSLLNLIGRYALRQDDYLRAIDIFALSIRINTSGEIYSLQGDAYRLAGDPSAALHAYEKARSYEHPPKEAFLQAAAILVSRNHFDISFAHLREAFALYGHQPEFIAAYESAITRYFEYRSSEAHELYNRDASMQNSYRTQADALLTRTLNDIRDWFTEFDNLPAPVGGTPGGYVIILANDDLVQCTHYRVEQKALLFEIAGISVKIFSHHDVQSFMDHLVGSHAAIFYRVGATPQVVRAILHANAMGLETFYEVDDLIFDPALYPDPLDTFQSQITSRDYAGLKFGVPLFRYAMSMCHSSIASTAALAEHMKLVTMTDRTVLIRNGLDPRNNTTIALVKDSVIVNNGRVRIFYGSGTKAHNSDFNDLVGPALVDIMKLNQDIELVIVGHLIPGEEFEMLRKRITFIPFLPDIDIYWSLLAACDINIAVLRPSATADCKSEIKWLEAAVLQIPSVVSRTTTFEQVIDNGVDGFLVENRGEWRAVLDRLVAQPALRVAAGAAARRKALQEYSASSTTKVLKDTFASVGRQGPLVPRKTRILVCNVFFHPQSLGGATRVVESNVKYFRDHCDDLHVGVFCSDEGVVPAGRLRMGHFGDVPVYRLSTWQDSEQDVDPFNHENATAFHRVLDDFQPDLVHFHSVQRLSASIVEVTDLRGIPYIVTLHDAWWISRYQFLVDADGLLTHPGRDVFGDCANEAQLALCVNRRSRLGSILRKAAKRLSVSHAFVEVYNDAGIAEVDVVENGTDTIGLQAIELRADGRLALGHIGGRSSHKGAFLIELALRRGAFGNLHLTMVDGALAPRQSVETVWGMTPVTLVGPYPQSEVLRLYARLNVLLAPSTWPESFGLVTREAIACGLWVIASKLGAIGKNVEEGKNGFLIDVANVEDLCRVLDSMNTNPDRFRKMPERITVSTRTTAEQAEELRSLYLGVTNKQACE